MPRLGVHLHGATLWAKREDHNSGITFGGNKTPKLEYLVADAIAQDCDTLISIGAVQSNHTSQGTAVAVHTEMPSVLIQDELGGLAGSGLGQSWKHSP